ncbi:hypothetical protein AB0I94_34470 [Streptomyces sp. NPDC050147]|uniref:hypothetical protein n=1 Tax=Streptomyces sp. NPDC050147 TaxID=3155513 RepID=UPI00343CC55B
MRCKGDVDAGGVSGGGVDGAVLDPAFGDGGGADGAGYAGGGGGLGVQATFHGAAGGGSSYVDGPGVSNGRTLAGTGGQAGGKDDPAYETGIGDANNHGQVVLQWTEFTLTPGGPPTVELTKNGPAGYPGISVASSVALAPVTVTVALPADRKLLFGTQILADYQLTLQNTDGTTTVYTGALSDDSTSLTFTDIDLHLPGTTTMWVAVSATHDSPAGPTELTYTVAGKTSASTPIVVKPAYTVSPGGAAVTVGRGGSPRYPGVEVRNNGSRGIPPQNVTVTLPLDSGLRFGTPSLPDLQLTILDSNGRSAVSVGTLSADGRTLAFTGVDLAAGDPGAVSVMWVCVSAAEDARTGPTAVAFTVGDQASASTTINVT